ncbi:hypothetical protein [Streptomyces sp. NPDC007355]|uniref:hypothetical protein n=1 Tax=Streptomyces sp. NPDC007355 TaxID=3364778 RepID=UPI0036B464FC
MNHRQQDRRNQHAPDEQHPRTAADEVLHEVEEAETRVLDNGEERGRDGEAADALSPSEDAQADAARRGA